LHGTISVQSLLPFSSLEELENQVKEIIEICAPGGGYILAPTHAIQTDTPLENILAVYETGRKSIQVNQ
ncbi:MAG: uroporphyrinogen decarboxylase family protein, partial [Atribacterota bacterium]|nr:uroporphyrinogen decarboxylase family protein [Atribacterota bacterium]